MKNTLGQGHGGKLDESGQKAQTSSYEINDVTYNMILINVINTAVCYLWESLGDNLLKGSHHKEFFSLSFVCKWADRCSLNVLL